MTEPIMCECGAVLVEGITDAGVIPVGGGDVIPFRRDTDYVLCEQCLRTYNVRDLIARAKDLEVISHLERMAEGADEPPPAAG